MKILFLSSHLPHARAVAGHQIVYQRMRRLIERGHEVGLCALRGHEEGVQQDPLYDALLEYRTIPAPGRKSLTKRMIDYAFSPVPPPFWPDQNPAMYRAVGEMVDTTRYDVVLAEFTGMGQYLYRNPWLSATRKILSIHECRSMSARTPLFLPERTFWRAAREHIQTRDLRRFEFELYRCVDRILTLSRYDHFTLSAQAPELRVNVVPPGIDLDYFDIPLERVSEQSLVFTGQYRDVANQDAFSWFAHNVWPRLHEHRSDLKFYVLGPHPTPEMYALARQLPGIEIKGEIADIRPYLAKANVFVCPIRMGSGLRIKILEAMAVGIPVVTTSAAAEGIPVQAGENVMMADAPAIMADAITLLLEDPGLCQQLAQSARKMVHERFHWDRSMGLLEEALTDVVAPAPTR